MAWASAEIPAAELALRALDYPLLIGQNATRVLTSSTMQWKQGGSWAAGADETDSDGPVLSARDEWSHTRTYPDSAQNTWYLLGNNSASPITIDSLVIMNPSSVAGATIAFEIADDNAYTTNKQELASFSPSANGDRLVTLDLHHTGSNPRRYTGVPYWRLKCTGAAITPAFGEVCLGRCRQMPRQPEEPGDRRGLRSKVSFTDSYGGVMSQDVRHTRRRFINHTFVLKTDTEEADYEAFWETDLSGGVGAWFYVDQPTTYPGRAWWMMFPEPDMAKPRTDWSARTVSIVAQEQGPHFLALE